MLELAYRSERGQSPASAEENRPNTLKLPLLLEVARDAQHPKAGEAKGLLALYLEADYGQDWNQWQSKIEDWLKENPE